MARADLVLLGEFGRAHGLKGEVRLKSYTGDALAIGRYGPLVGLDGRGFVLNALRRPGGEQADLLVVRVEGVATREAAEALNRTGLYAPRERLDVSLDEDEFLLADLVGLSAVDRDGSPVGTIAAVPNYGGGDLLEVVLAATGRRVLVPFTKAFVPDLDLAARTATVDLPADDDEEAPGDVD